MKIPTDNLFQLIQAMTASEKRYLKRHYSSEKSITTELFDFINSLKQYNEEEVKEYFIRSKVSKNLKVYKVQLTDLILKSLVSYHNKKSIRSKIRIGLEETELLLAKQLYGLAQGRVKKIKEICLKYEEHEYIFAILFYEILINSFFDVQLKVREYPILDEFDHYADKIKNTYRLKKINFSLNDKNNNKLTEKLSSKEEKIYSRILETETEKVKEGKSTFNEQYYLNSSLSLINKLVNDNPEKEYDFKKKNVALFEANPHFIENHTSYYYAALYNLLICCRRTGRHKELISGIRKIKTLTIEYPFLERNLSFVYYLEIKHNFQKGNYEALIDEFENAIIKHIKKHNQSEESLPALCFIYFTMTHMILDHPQKVQFYLRRLHAMSKQLNPSYELFFDILELISHYETGDYDVIQNLLMSFKRKDKKQAGNDTFYIEILDFFTDLIHIPTDKVLLISNLKAKAASTQKDGLLNLLNEFLLDNWLDAIESDKTFAEIAKTRQLT